MNKKFNYEIIDDFLPKNNSDEIENILLKNVDGIQILPWYFINNKSSDGILMQRDDINNFQFAHIFYEEHNIHSNHYNTVVHPFIFKLDPLALVRVKGNLTTITPNIIKYGWHTDFDNYEHTTAIYYVNTNNGKTIFKNGLEVESVKNRMVIFDGWMEHTATSSTDTKARCVLNFNYIKKNRND
jgi:hypothetical protein